jgi:hypothetical protein
LLGSTFATFTASNSVAALALRRSTFGSYQRGATGPASSANVFTAP